jgi:hypothetical protein
MTPPSSPRTPCTPRTLKARCTAALLALCLSPTAWASAEPLKVCVWDPLGAAGPLFDGMKAYALAVQKLGVDVTLKPYVDERVASEDFRVGQCDGLVATSIRTRPYNAVTPAVDYAGAATIVRDGKIDIDASYQVVYKAMQVLASPGAAKLNVQDKFEVGGILPSGALYTMASDRSIFTRGFAGARMPAFDHDKVQAYLIQKIGAQPVSADINNFANKFNNGIVDVIFAPAVAYQPLEIYRGVGKKGGVSRFPLAFTSMQMVFVRSRFPEGFGEKSRQLFLEKYELMVVAIRKAEASIPADVWVDYAPKDAADFVTGQRDTRVELANLGYYNKQGLKIMKRVRCSVNPTASECSTPAEIEW